MHAVIVSLGLAKMGHQSSILSTRDFGKTSGITALHETSQTHRFDAWENEHKVDLGKVSRCWLRRPQMPAVEKFDQVDWGYAEREAQQFMLSFLGWLETRVPMVNSYLAARRIEDKLHQLRLAKKIGFRTPQTVMSFSIAEARTIAANWKSEVILKTLIPMAWIENGKRFAAYATKINLSDLPTDNSYRGPLLLQEYIGKAFEVRATMFGEELVCARINGQSHHSTEVDWRLGFESKKLQFEPINPSDELKMKMREWLDKARLTSGSFDFIVTASGEWVFLECNESGNFLFKEDICEDIRILDVACQFLASKSPRSFRLKSYSGIRYRDLKTEATQILSSFASFDSEEKAIADRSRPRHYSHAY